MGKRCLIAGSLILLVILCSNPGTIKANISGSKHDFSLATSWNPGGEICEPCHTPHNANTTIADAPLWNHDVTEATFVVYDSPTFTGPIEQPQGPSKLCLSCHDGTIKLDSFGGDTGDTAISGPALLGTNLKDDHPVSVYWDHKEIINVPCSNCHNVQGPDNRAVPFFNHYVECSSCHDTHNTAGNPKLLRLPMQGSELCLHCHGK
jgi:predicted CXXCH cytochrome family protein